MLCQTEEDFCQLCGGPILMLKPMGQASGDTISGLQSDRIGSREAEAVEFRPLSR